ncbi:MAG: hypothetical protein OQK04_19380 [Kangiellaceae bacterium]|nr:hypothetical protein [Kangiellaceae bacterium]MCW9000882.1 hypothetical protein [Kangiellaceae bacterium]
MEVLKTILLFDVFPFLCRLIAGTLIFLAFYAIGFPPEKDLNPSAITLLIFSAFFFLLPVAKKMSIGKLLTYEREVAKVKEEVGELKTETREFLSLYSNMITAISNTVSQTVNVHLPGKEQVLEAKEKLNSTLKDDDFPERIEDKLEAYLNESGYDVNFALARLRMELERILREILGKRTQTADPLTMKSRYLSARQLFRELVNQNPNYKELHSSFDYVLKVCNAAIHGQKISESHAHEAIYMGLKMLNEFKHVGK